MLLWGYYDRQTDRPANRLTWGFIVKFHLYSNNFEFVIKQTYFALTLIEFGVNIRKSEKNYWKNYSKFLSRFSERCFCFDNVLYSLWLFLSVHWLVSQSFSHNFSFGFISVCWLQYMHIYINQFSKNLMSIIVLICFLIRPFSSLRWNEKMIFGGKVGSSISMMINVIIFNSFGINVVFFFVPS